MEAQKELGLWSIFCNKRLNKKIMCCLKIIKWTFHDIPVVKKKSRKNKI